MPNVQVSKQWKHRLSSTGFSQAWLESVSGCPRRSLNCSWTAADVCHQRLCQRRGAKLLHALPVARFRRSGILGCFLFGRSPKAPRRCFLPCDSKCMWCTTFSSFEPPKGVLLHPGCRDAGMQGSSPIVGGWAQNYWPSKGLEIHS